MNEENGDLMAEGEPLEIIDEYDIDEYTKIRIIKRPESLFGPIEYRVVGPALTEAEEKIIEYVRKWFIEEYPNPELNIERLSIIIDEAVEKFAPKIIRKLTKKKPTEEELDRVRYIAKRDIVGFGKLEPLLKDPNIEDIHVLGIGKPVFIWHRLYENLPTNVYFLDAEDLQRHLQKMMLTTGKFVSLSRPIVDGTLPMGYRINVVHSIISELGTAITIRKYKEIPFTIIDLIRFGTLTPELAGLLWVAMENKRSVFVVGETAAGKSFPGETLLIIKKGRKVSVMKARDLYDSLNVEEKVIGEHHVKQIPENIEIYTLSVGHDLKLRWERVKAVIRHKDNRPLVKVRTATAETITTVDHNFIRLNPVTGELESVRASEIQPGWYLVNAWPVFDSASVMRLTPYKVRMLGELTGRLSKELLHGRKDIPVEQLFNKVRESLRGKHHWWEIAKETYDKYVRDVMSVSVSHPSILELFISGLMTELLDTYPGKELCIEVSSQEVLASLDLILKRAKIPHEVLTDDSRFIIKVKDIMEFMKPKNRDPFPFGKPNELSTEVERKLYDSDIFLDPIREVIMLDVSDEWLYDLELENTHNFLIGQTGWRLNHNTTLLNAVATLIPLNMKIVVIEEVREIRLPHPNSVFMVTREGVEMLGNVTLYDLVKTSLRQRPDYIIVGEIRGEEAYVLLQAISLGHGGLGTMHAEGVEAAVRRLMAPPMNIPPYLMRLLDLIIHVSKVKIKGQVKRYVLTAAEISHIDPETKEPELNTIYKVGIDEEKGASIEYFSPGNSLTLKKIRDIRGMSLDTLINKIHIRAEFLRKLAEKNPSYEEAMIELTKYKD